MPAKKGKAKGKSKDDIDDTSSVHSMEIESSQQSNGSQRGRAKRYSKDEVEMLLKICADYHGILSKNSNSDADKKTKAKAWEKIKRTFDERCRSEAIYVNVFIIDLHYSQYKFYFFHAHFNSDLFWFIYLQRLKTEQFHSSNRSIKKLRKMHDR